MSQVLNEIEEGKQEFGRLLSKNRVCEKPPRLLPGISLNLSKGDLDDSCCDIPEGDVFDIYKK